MLADYLTAEEAAARWSCHPETVKRLIHEGRVPAIKWHRKWLIARAVVDQGYPGSRWAYSLGLKGLRA